MNSSDMLGEIKELNLTYLMLAQHMIREDKAAACFASGSTSSWPISCGSDRWPGIENGGRERAVVPHALR